MKILVVQDSPLLNGDFSSRVEVVILQKIETRFLLPALRGDSLRIIFWVLILTRRI